MFGKRSIKKLDDIQILLKNLGWFSKLPGEKQEKFRYHLHELLKLLEYEG